MKKYIITEEQLELIFGHHDEYWDYEDGVIEPIYASWCDDDIVLEIYKQD